MAKSRQPISVHPSATGNPPGSDEIIALAKRVTDACSAPVVGGVAVLLHGGGRHTRDIDVYSANFWETHTKLEAAGILWNSEARGHYVGGVAVHMVGDEALGGPPVRISTIRGVKVIGLADLIRGKLTVGLTSIRRSKDLTHVLDLIERVPLDKSFVTKLPRHLRKPFKELVEQVFEPPASQSSPRRSPVPPQVFYRKYAP